MGEKVNLLVKDYAIMAYVPENRKDSAAHIFNFRGALSMLTLKKVGKYRPFTSRELLKDISFMVKGGEILTIMGPHQSGKTLLLHCLAGLIRIDEGEIYLKERLINSKRRREKIGMVFLSREFRWRNIIPERWKMVEGKISDIKREEIVVRKTKLSPGEEKTRAFFNYLLSEKNIFLLDDAFSSIDVIMRKKLGSLLKDITEKLRLPAVMVTNDEEEAYQVGQRVLWMERGRAKPLK